MGQDNRGTILVVDDNPNNLGVISDCLGSANFEVRVAQSGESALDKVEYTIPDLILLDVMMPGIDGFETCSKLKANPKIASIPIIFMTALSDTESKVRAFQMGAVDYVTKPFQQAEVLARIETHLRCHQMMQEITNTNNLLAQKNQEQAAIEQQLRATVKDLQVTQHQLIQSEKLSSLGKMVAGIAHEINNPLGFIQGNIEHLETYFSELAHIIQVCDKRQAECSTVVDDALADIDFPYILKDVPKVFDSMTLGTQRINGIIQGLRSFSNLDQSSEKVIDLHQAIDNTIMLLQYRLQGTPSRSTIAVDKRYDLNFSRLRCFPKPLNQAIFQILNNAIDALTCQPVPDPHIKIETAQMSDQMSDYALVRISDNGIGITSDICSSIFDPFFTTKPVGQGVGLGLATAYQTIVEQHKGQLTCQSSPGEGSTFEISLPLPPLE